MSSRQKLEEFIKVNIWTIILILVCIMLYMTPDAFQLQNKILNSIIFAPKPLYIFLPFLIILIKLGKGVTKKSLRYLLKFAKVVVIIPLSLYVFYYTVVIFDSITIKSPVLKFLEKDNYSYFADTPRRSALDDLYVNSYKEKVFGPFFKIKKKVSSDELVKLGLDTIVLHKKYEQLYFEWAKSRKSN